MFKRISLRLALASSGVVLLSLVTVPSVNAQDASTTDPALSPEVYTTNVVGSEGTNIAETERTKAKVEKIKADALAKAAELRAAAEQRKAAAKDRVNTKLADTKLRVCQNRETIIGNLMTRIGDRGQKQLELVDTIAARVDAYKVEKQLTVAGYEVLATEVAARKAAATTAVAAAKDTKVEFKCDGTDPKGAASTFKDGLKLQNEAIRAYRDAVKSMLVAVKQAQKAVTDTTEGVN